MRKSSGKCHFSRARTGTLSKACWTAFLKPPVCSRHPFPSFFSLSFVSFSQSFLTLLQCSAFKGFAIWVLGCWRAFRHLLLDPFVFMIPYHWVWVRVLRMIFLLKVGYWVYETSSCIWVDSRLVALVGAGLICPEVCALHLLSVEFIHWWRPTRSLMISL